jgi:CheY-like chemotaxis protein
VIQPGDRGADGGGALLPLSGVRILVVDHDEALRWLQAHILHRRGADVLEVASGAEALRLLGGVQVDVVLLDCSLYDMPASEVRRRMLENPTVAAVPVIFLAGSEADQPSPEGEVFLREPLDGDKLAVTIRLVLGRAAASGGV